MDKHYFHKTVSPVVLLFCLSLTGYVFGESVYDLTYYGLACENNAVLYQCPKNYVVKIISASFGRRDNESCITDIPENKTISKYCDIAEADQIMKNLCDGNEFCRFIVNNETFTDVNGSCLTVHNYLDVIYKCEAVIYNVNGCEGDKLEFSCPSDSVVHVHNVIFGRNDDNITCQHEHIYNTSCVTSDPGLQRLSSLCNGNSSCEFYAYTELLGDPCPGTYKTVQVEYICGECQNSYDTNQCELYASWGECNKNINWMNAFCRKACWQCQYTGTCTNIHSHSDNCDNWAKIGECSVNTEWMTNNCRSSCNACQGLWQNVPVKSTTTEAFCESKIVNAMCEPGFSLRIDNIRFGRWSLDTCPHETVNASTQICATPSDALNKTKILCDGRNNCSIEARTDIYGEPCPGILKQAEVTYTCQDCKNALVDTECEERNKEGACETNHNWMMDNCFRTCTACDVRECGNAFDEDPQNIATCDYWSIKGDCTKHPDYFKENCATSCNMCNEQPPESTTPAPGTPIYKETCEGQSINITCPAGYYVRLDSVFFGRLDNVTCPHESINTTECTTPEGTLTKARSICNGRNPCYFVANHRAWGDPCPGTYKAASILYTCSACENAALDSDCIKWAAEGKCMTDYTNMIDKCFKTCSKCEHKGCGNNHVSSVDCDYWASRGECLNFPGYMLDNCRESCQSCTSIPEVLPMVSRSFCEIEKEQLICPENYHIEINSMFYGRVDNDTCVNENIFTFDCPTPDGALEKLRNLCEGRATCYYEARSELWGDNCRTSYKVANVSYSCHLCRNNATDEECVQWAAEGKCITEHSMMMEQCYQTCSGCLYKVCGNKYESYLDCDYWSVSGECLYNPAFMLNKCNESCDYCQPVPTTEAPPTTTPTLPHPDQLEPKQVTLCEKQIKHLDCPTDYFLRMNNIFFGRINENTCPHITGNNTNCPSVPSLVNKARVICDGRPNCWFEAIAKIWGDSCPETYKYGIADYTCQLCKDVMDTTSCEEMKVQGKCLTDYNNMMNQCFKTCSQCDKGCQNTHNVSIDCDYWALTGECHRNSVYMANYCQAACRLCPDIPRTTPSPFRCSGMNNCSGHGKCTGEDKCSCDYGWYGSECAEYNCLDHFSCSGNGWCFGPNMCFCDSYVSGMTCNKCDVTLQVGPACLPCPPCQHGQCTEDQQDMSTNSYIGCYEDKVEGRDLPYLVTGVAIAKSIECVSQCRMLGYRYAGVQNGNICYCGNSYGKYGSKDTCTSVCTTAGDRCGGIMASSIWRTYQGKCTCETGWSGPMCSECTGNNCPTPQIKVMLTIVLEMQWKAIYSDPNAPETSHLYDKLSNNLFQFYQSINTNVLQVQIGQLRKGSVIVEHDIIMKGQLDSLTEENFKCSIYNALQKSGNVGGDSAKSDTNLEQLCAWRQHYCKNNGELVRVSEKWICRCPDKYNGDFCENTQMDRTILIVIIVASCAVLLIILLVIVCVCARRSSKSNRDSNTPSASGEQYTMHVTDTDSLAKLKDQGEVAYNGLSNDGYS